MSYRPLLQRKKNSGSPRPFICLRRLFLFAALLALGFFPGWTQHAAAQGARAQQYYPGLRTLGIWDPALNIRLDVAVWYPSIRPSRDFRLDGWALTASRNGREVPGRYPLLLVSHDAASNRLALHDLAAALARKGFVVAIPTHAQDSLDDASGMFRASTLMDRPLHLLLTLETVLATPELAPLVDESRIGLLGVGAGSATVLQLMGARPDVAGISAYCLEEPGADLYCTPWAKRHFPLLEKEFSLLLSQRGPTAFTPALTALQKPEPPAPQPAPIPEKTEGAPEEAGEENSVMPPPLPTPPKPTQKKQPLRRVSAHSIKAAALVTPGLSALFSSQSLQSLPAPVAILSVNQDEVYPVAFNATRLRDALPQGTRYLSIPDVGHYAMQAPCPQALLESFPAVCGKTSPQDAKARQTRDTFLTDFFLETLGSPLPPLPETESPAPKTVSNATAKNAPSAQSSTAAMQNTLNATAAATKPDSSKNATKRPKTPRRATR